MITIVVMTLVGIGLSLRSSFRGIAPKVIGGIAGLVVGFLMAAMIGIVTARHWTVQGTWKLHSFGTTAGSSGTFVWGTGSLSQGVSYRLLVENQGGTVSPLIVNATAGNTEILEREELEDEGKLTVQVYQFDRGSFLWNFGLPDRRNFAYFYTVEVPKGSVRTEFFLK